VAGLPPPADFESRRRRRLRTNPAEVHDRLAIFVVRALFFFVAAALGVYGAHVLGALTAREIDPRAAMLLACGTALALIALESFFSRGPIRTISAFSFGLLMGLVLSLVFQPVVEFIGAAVSTVDVQADQRYRTLLSYLHLLTTTLFCYFGVTLLLHTKDDFKFIIPYVEFRKEVKGHQAVLLDTSCFIDGRVQALLATGFLDYRLVVPKFVLEELQSLADSAQRSTRERGRRGMDILREVERRYHLEITEDSRKPGEEVDAALMALTRNLGGKLLTTDFNLQKHAGLQGVEVLNVNDLAAALKPTFVPGEVLQVRLLRDGEEKGQAVGFLNDGTMVVVEEARSRIGQVVTVEVTSSLQTHAGKMVFGKLRQGPARGQG
jgi:uncharacterized protein YacL